MAPGRPPRDLGVASRHQADEACSRSRQVPVLAELPELAGDAVVGVEAFGEAGLPDLDGALDHVVLRPPHAVGEVPGGDLVVRDVRWVTPIQRLASVSARMRVRLVLFTLCSGRRCWEAVATPLPVGRTDFELATVVSPRRGYVT